MFFLLYYVFDFTYSFVKIHEMEKKYLGKTGIAVTPVGMGVLTIGHTQLDCPPDEGAAIVRHAIECGINFFDTAEFYQTYHYIDQAMKDLKSSFDSGALPRPVIASKSLACSYKEMQKAIEDCRAALDIDTIEIFLLHELMEEPDFEHRIGAWECLHDAKAKGQVRAIGISTHHADVALTAAGTPGMDIIFPLINYKGFGIRSGDGEGTREEMEGAIKAAAERGIGVFAMKVLCGGNFAAEYIEALDYAAALDGVQSIMLGMGCKRDVDDAVRYFSGSMPNDYKPDVDNKRMSIDKSDCIGCGACINKCTSNAISNDKTGSAEINTEKCIQCGYCVPVCPTRALIFL